ncbi:MAG: protoporphyrinogen oxidase [Pirellulaceae bacterium]|nr:protoporphyrinogen oxidase [Pirellulaceae bacterium]
MTQDDQPRVAVIGGGLSGLATAVHLHLADPNIQLTVFEAADRAGGVIQTLRIDPFLVDLGADMFALEPPAAHDLCKQLNLLDQLIEPQQIGRGAYIVRQGRLVPIPDGFVLMRATKLWPMLTTKLLSPRGKLRWLVERFQRNNVGDTDQSVAEFVRTRMGREVLQRIVGPLVAGIYTADIEKLSLLATMGPIAKMVRTHGSLAAATSARKREGQDSTERVSAGARYSQFRAFDGGMGRLIDSLIAELPDHIAALPGGVVQTGRAVSAIEQNTGTQPRWSVHVDDHAEAFDHVVVATPPRIAAELLQNHAPIAAKHLSSIEAASTAIVVLGVRQADLAKPITTFGFVVPAIENRRILACSFASTKFAGRAPEDHLLIRVFIGGALQPQLLDLDDNELIQIARQELSELIGLGGQSVMEKVVRWNNAMPQYHVGHLQRVREIDADINSIAGLSMVSNALHGVGIAPVIQAAKRTADRVLAEIRV